ncbi:23S rRNA (uracil(1939)-C(5))-methyltransferase RlmD [Dehalobacter sp. DCM]|uniref:23S rRNA (uracil(1939)-C(5))-methyltransferase RlmD n=1 Tax=Dehalobacter sp. DCM TaxID=2907827 RepID=UPI00308186DC|nr:23S rRNA (uracil(1939)-C(5))-methyltransferase RlmD [Dehalobacter sp. DCM]
MGHSRTNTTKESINRIEIIRLSSDGSGVGYLDGKTTFVQGMLPGEKGKVRITTEKKNYQRAEVVEITEFSPERQDPPCGVFGACGGCDLQHMHYAATLIWKRRWVTDVLQRIGGLQNISVEPVLGMDTPWRYRNKALLHRDESGQWGYYREKSTDVVLFSDCLLLSERTNARIDRFQTIMGASCPGIRTATFRESSRGKGLILLEGNTDEEKEALGARIREMKNSDELAPDTCSILFPKENKEYAGSGPLFLNTYMDDLRFKVSPGAFLQVNPSQTEKLYAHVLAWADLRGEETVWDLYCGIGTISLMLARKAGHVIGVEENPDAVTDAEYNAEFNKVTNVRFIQGKTEKQLDKLERSSGKPDLVVVDPPRAGMDQAVIERLLKIQPDRIIYVSCDPGTLARDLKLLTQGTGEVDGIYSVKKIQPVDMFPWTRHVETIIKMTKCGSEGKK